MGSFRNFIRFLNRLVVLVGGTQRSEALGLYFSYQQIHLILNWRLFPNLQWKHFHSFTSSAVCAKLLGLFPKKGPQPVPGCCPLLPPQGDTNFTPLWVILLYSKKCGKEGYFGVPTCVFMLSEVNP